MFNTYNENDPLLIQQYQQNNYKIRTNRGGEKGLCIIYFSGNGLYVANDIDSFYQRVICEDRYEWTKLSARIKPEKEIFVRDIFLSWYAKGINAKLFNIHKIIDWLRNETQGSKEIVTVGNSAGGYMAVICGYALNADRIFTICGQFSLSHHNGHINSNPLLFKYGESGFYENYIFIDEKKQSIVYYIYSALVDHDHEQASFVERSNVRILMINSNRHGKTINPFDFPILLSLSKSRLDKLFYKFKGRIITADEFSIELEGKIYLYINKIKQKIIQKAQRFRSKLRRLYE